MNCSACGHTNRDGAKFCAQCATALPVACASCGSELDLTARFCDQCGTPVAGAPEPVESAAARKVVTVLFADLVGSTSFGERVDAESAREAMAGYHAMATDAVEAAGGTIAKFIGDGVMALFGVPETTEDDADRAVSAGLALQRGFLPIRERIERRHGADLGLRVGINTGEIVLAEGDADLVGDAINTAARLEAACAPGEVLVGEETWRLTRSHISYEVLGEVDVKGKDEPVATFRVADEEVRDDEQAPPFVGRADELARLQGVFDDAVAQRSARLATVIGSPGVGKTRISREFCESLGEAVVVAELRCERAGTATFAPIADLLRTITTIDDESDADHVRDRLRELVAELDDADRIADLLASFVGAAPARSTEEAFLAVRRLVEAVGRTRPLVVVVDDIQWAEPLFLDLLEHLAEWVADAPAFLIGLARPEVRDLRPSLAVESRTLAASIGLEGLDAAATAELAARLIGAASLPEQLVARLPDSTEGNPLFVRELMRMLVDDGVIEETAGGWQLTIDAEAVEVPPTIQSLLAARLDRMPADERRLVELASVVGSEFALGAVAEISEATAPELRLALERLRRRELVESTGMYWGDEPIYRFHHVLIRDAAYRRLLKRARADLHLRVGEWTERTAVGLPGEHEVTIAYHFEQVHEYRRQLDDIDDDMAAVGGKAAELLGRAAERSLERDDLPAASSLAERALARLDDGDPMIPPLLVVAAEALLGLGDVGGGRPVVESLSAAVGDDERLAPWADAFVAQLTMLTEPDRLHQAEEVADRAATRLAGLGDEAGVAKARLVRAGALARLGQVGRCEAELDQALTAARSAGDRRRVAAVLGAAPLAALWGPSPIPRAGGRCLDVIRLLRITTGSPAVEATSVRCQAVLEALRGRFDTARTMLSDSRATVEELGLRHALGETDLFTGIVELLAGDAAAAEGPLRSAYHALGRLGIGADAGQAAAYLARAELLLGRVDEAAALAAESAELAGENLRTAVAARTAQAEILAAQGRYEEAVAVASEAVARAEGTDIIVDHAAASAVLAHVAALAGDIATAERAARVSADLYEQKAATVTAPAPVEPPAAPASDDVEDEPWNEADRLTRRFVELFTAGARDEWLPMLSPDQVTSDRRPLVGVDTAGADQVADAYPRDQDSKELSSSVETVAVRGETFALVRWKAASTSGREWDSFHLTRWTADGLNDLNIIFPPDGLSAALAELDRLQLEEVEDPPVGSEERTSETATPAVHDPWNEADRQARRLIELFLDRSSDEWLDMLDPDHVSDDRQRIVAHRLDGSDAIGAIWTRENMDDLASSVTETIATRGEHLALHRWTLDMGSSRWASDALNITRWNQRGLVDLNIRFDVDQLGEAVAELERLYRDEIGDSIEALQLREFGRGMGQLAAGDVDGFLRLHDPSFVIRDHRQLGWPDLDLEGYRARLESIVAIEGEVLVFQEQVLRLDHTTSTCAPQRIVFTLPDGTEQISRSVMVMIMDPHTGLITRMEQFDEDELAAAVARYDELMAERGPVIHNEASVRASFVNGWIRRGDDELVAAAVADDASSVDEHGEPFDLAPVGHREVMAVRGDRLALTHVAGPGQAFAVEEIDERGRLWSVRRFGMDQLAEAVAYLETRWVDVEGAALPAAARVGALYRAAMNLHSVEQLDGLLADDHEVVDRRPMGWPRISRDEALRQSAPDAVGAPGVLVVSELLEIREGGTVAQVSMLAVDDDGSTTRGFNALGVTIVRGGRVSKVEMFAEDDVDVAVARLGELTAGAPGEHEPWNEADRLSRRLHAAFLGGSAESWYDLLDPDHVSDDRRELVGHQTVGRDETAEMWAGNAAQAHIEPPSLTLDTVAARGDRLVLQTINVETTFGDSGDAYRLLRWNKAGLCDLLVRFGGGDHADAFAELDRLWFASVNPDQQGVSRLAVALGEAWVAPSTHPFDDLIATDFELVDRRTLGMGSLDRSGFEEALRGREADGAVGAPVPSRVEFVSDDVMVFRANNLGHTPESGVDWEEIACNVMVVEGDRIARLEMFDENHWDGAMFRAEELIAERGSRQPLENAATRMRDRFVGREDEVGPEVFSDDFVREDRRTTVSADLAGKAEFLVSSDAYQELGGAFTNHPAIAIRGDRWALFPFTVEFDDARVEWLLVAELDAEGRVRRHVQFDPGDLATAQDELDRLYLATLTEDEAATLRPGLSFRSAMSARGTAVMSVLLADEFVAIDHRDLAFPALDRDDFLEINRQRDELFGEALVFTTDIHRIEGEVIVASNRMAGLTPESGVEWLHEFVNIFIVRDGRLQGLENFGPDQLDAALARADELIGRANADGRLENAMTRFRDRWEASSWELTEAWLAEDFVREDRRATVAAGAAGRSEYLESLAVFLEMGAVFDVGPAIAIRGERFALFPISVEIDGAAIDSLFVAELDDVDRVRRIIQFDADDLTAAMGELGHAWAATLPPESVALLRLAAEYERVAYADDDRDEVFADDVVFVDHRPVGFGEVGLAEWRRFQGQRANEGQRAGLAPEVVTVAPHVLLFSNVITIEAGDDTSWEEFYFQLLVGRDGKVARLEVFAEDQRELAIERARELAES